MKSRQQFLFILIFTLFLLGNAGHFMLPQVFTSTKTRAYSSDSKAHLHNLYLACNSFWANEDASKTCTIGIAKKEYGYFQSQYVNIYGSGPKNDFCAFAWHQKNGVVFSIDSVGRINLYLGMEPMEPQDNIWIYDSRLLWRVIYYSPILILPLATIILTLWAGAGSILSKKRIGVNAIAWALISFIAVSMPSGSQTSNSGRILMFIFTAPIFLFSALWASSLIEWGMEIGKGKNLPDYLKNQNATALKTSGIYLYRVIGILLAINVIYLLMISNYYINYQNQLAKFSEEIQSSIQTDPSSFQNMCNF